MVNKSELHASGLLTYACVPFSLSNQFVLYTACRPRDPSQPLTWTHQVSAFLCGCSWCSLQQLQVCWPAVCCASGAVDVTPHCHLSLKGNVTLNLHYLTETFRIKQRTLPTFTPHRHLTVKGCKMLNLYHLKKAFHINHRPFLTYNSNAILKKRIINRVIVSLVSISRN
jgi:hypothetical protein